MIRDAHSLVKMSQRIGPLQASTTALKAVPASSPPRADGCITAVADGSLWLFDADSTLVASDTVLAPDAGNGRWLCMVPAGGGAGGSSYKAPVRLATAASLAAYTRTANVITADANGALGNIDGVAVVVGDRILLTSDYAAAGADVGIYDVTSIGGASAKYSFTRSADADTTGEIVGGSVIPVQAGTNYGGEFFIVTNASDITLNTTAITMQQLPDYDDLGGTTATTGGELIGQYDPGSIITATTVGGATRENRALIDTNVTNIATAAAELNTHRPGVPMQNRLRLLGAPGAAVAGNTVTIGADVYEFNAATPPSGGTGGYIWVYNGATSAASRTNLINAINNVTDAPNITYDGAVTESFLAAAGVTTGDVTIVSADAAGGTPTPSTTATAVGETLATATDIWDNATCRAGLAQVSVECQMASITLTAADIAKGTLEIFFSFTPTQYILSNNARPQNEAHAIVGDAVSLTLAGGASPNNQTGDVITVIAFG